MIQAVWKYSSLMRASFRGLVWCLFDGWRFKCSLRNAGCAVVALTPIRLSSWHRGARYFKGDLPNGKSVFIKTGGIYGQIRREFFALSVVSSAMGASLNIPALIYHDIDGKYPFLAFNWVIGETLHSLPKESISQAEFASVCGELLKILGILSAANIIHRDLTPSNLIVARDLSGKMQGLFIIDFAFAVVK